MEQIKETIVVEGKDDEAAVKKALKCNIITTSGFGLNEKIFKQIEYAAKITGIIIFTDPDHAGERIRERIAKRCPNCKHAFLSREDAEYKGDIGIENASPESILDALSKVRTLIEISEVSFTKQDMITLELEGYPHSAVLRNKMGKVLGIGYCNAKQFLNRLNHYGVTRQEFIDAYEIITKE